MFDFFKRKKETPVCEVSPYEQLLDDIYIIEQSKKTEFDPYDRNNLIERKEISRLKIQRFEKFFSEFNEESFAAALPANYLWPASECWEHITGMFELSKEELAWDIDVERIMDQIMVLSVGRRKPRKALFYAGLRVWLPP